MISYAQRVAYLLHMGPFMPPIKYIGNIEIQMLCILFRSIFIFICYILVICIDFCRPMLVMCKHGILCIYCMIVEMSHLNQVSHIWYTAYHGVQHIYTDMFFPLPTARRTPGYYLHCLTYENYHWFIV